MVMRCETCGAPLTTDSASVAWSLFDDDANPPAPYCDVCIELASTFDANLVEALERMGHRNAEGSIAHPERAGAG